MSRRSAAVLAWGLAALLAAGAGADPPDQVEVGVPEVATGPVNGLTCGFVGAIDPTLGGYSHTGEIFGGPVTGLPDARKKIIQIHCSIHLASGWRHSDPAVWERWAAHPEVIALAPTYTTFSAAVGNSPYLCTRVAVGPRVYYWNGEASAWSDSPNVPCALMITQDPVPFENEVCPVTALLLPPEGDISLTGPVYVDLMDCP